MSDKVKVVATPTVVKIKVVTSPSDLSIDGGHAASVYTAEQVVDGGGA